MKILVMGGTQFVGRAIVEAALARGHEVVLCNRGQRNRGLFPQLETLIGDRDSELDVLRGRRFDAVIDSSAYSIRQVQSVLAALAADLPHYTFISSISAYGVFPPRRRFNEDTPAAEGDEGYGPQKARGEDLVNAAYPGRVTVIRPGLVVGPYDPTDRFTYWVRRVAAGGDVLAPGRAGRPVQFIDVRDLAAWTVQATEARLSGVYNAVGPAPMPTMGELLDQIRTALDSNAHFRWIPDDVLLAAGVAPWTELPVWLPEDDETFGGMLLADNQRAVAAGLKFRPIAETVRDTFAWDRSGDQPGDPSKRVAPLTAEREAKLLAAHAAAA